MNLNILNLSRTLFILAMGILALSASTALAEDYESTPLVEEEGMEVDFPHEEPPLWAEVLEAVPTVLTWPDEHLGDFFGHLIRAEHVHPETELGETALGIQSIPNRPSLLIESNELFLGPGFLNQGIEIPTGAIWRPSLWVFGEFRSALQYFDDNRGIDPTMEWANRLDLFGQLNLSGTERVLVGLRPLDEQRGGNRNFTGYDIHNSSVDDAWNGHVQTLFFEGDFGEIFPNLDPYDTRMLDFGFSVGRMPLLAQQGLLINEDTIDAITLTRNTLSGGGNLNLRTTAVYSWRGINRNSAMTSVSNDFDPDSKMVALLTESDFAVRTINVDGAYAYGDRTFGDLFAVGISSIRRTNGYHNTYNSSVHLLASFPDGTKTDYADQGELLFAQTSWTPHHTDDIVYANAFLAIDQFTSPARGPLMGGPLGQTGILFSSAGLGRSGAPIAVRTNDIAGGSLGYQMFFDTYRKQIIWEVGGVKETKGVNRGVLGTVMRYQQALGQHYIIALDAFVTKHEGSPVGQGARAEVRIKF